MNLTTKLIKKIEEEIIKTREFEFFSPTTAAHAVAFNVNGEIGENNCGLVSWECAYYDKNKQIQIRIHAKDLDGNEYLHSICVLNNTGVWQGRDRRNNGTVLIKPIQGEKKWKELSNPINFYKNQSVDDEEDGFTYKEHLSPQIDWKPYEWNIATKLSNEYMEFVKKSKTSVAIIAYDRPIYFRRTVESISKNPEIKDLPVFVFLDKPEPAREHVTNEQRIYVKEMIPHCIVIQRPRNFGCGRNLIDVRRQLFDNLGFERVFVFEDDMVISENYIGLTIRIMDWAESNYSNVGTVQSWNYCAMSAENKKEHLNKVWPTLTNWWGYLMSKESWDSIKKEVYRYEELFLGGEYKDRPNKSILKWFGMKMKKSKFSRGKNPFPLHDKFEYYRKRYFDGPPTGQDAVTMHLFHKEGWVRLTPIVNRGLYIGKHGIHMSPTRFSRDGFDLIILHEFDEDRILDEFEFSGDMSVTQKTSISNFIYTDAIGT